MGPVSIGVEVQRNTDGDTPSREKAATGFWPDRIGTLVSMATDSSHRVIMGKSL